LTRKGLRSQVSKSNGRSTGKQISGKDGNKSVTDTAKTKSALSFVHPFDKNAGQIDGDFQWQWTSIAEILSSSSTPEKTDRIGAVAHQIPFCGIAIA
jgi:hypothetical protein